MNVILPQTKIYKPVDDMNFILTQTTCLTYNVLLICLHAQLSNVSLASNRAGTKLFS